RDQRVRIGCPLVVRVDDLFVESDRQRHGRLPERRVALGDDRGQHDREEEQAYRDGEQAVDAEATLGRVAALDADVAAWVPGGDARRTKGDVGHSYCSRYFLTM